MLMSHMQLSCRIRGSHSNTRGQTHTSITTLTLARGSGLACNEMCFQSEEHCTKPLQLICMIKFTWISWFQRVKNYVYTLRLFPIMLLKAACKILYWTICFSSTLHENCNLDFSKMIACHKFLYFFKPKPF